MKGIELLIKTLPLNPSYCINNRRNNEDEDEDE